MHLSQFAWSINMVFGSVAATSLSADMYLCDFSATVNEALQQGIEPQKVWDSLLAETGKDKSMSNIYLWSKADLKKAQDAGTICGE